MLKIDHRLLQFQDLADELPREESYPALTQVIIWVVPKAYVPTHENQEAWEPALAPKGWHHTWSTCDVTLPRSGGSFEAARFNKAYQTLIVIPWWPGVSQWQDNTVMMFEPWPQQVTLALGEGLDFEAGREILRGIERYIPPGTHPVTMVQVEQSKILQEGSV